MKQLRNKTNEKDKEKKRRWKKTNNRQMWLTVNRFLSSSLSNIIGTSKDGTRKTKHQNSFSISTKFSAQQTKHKKLNCSVMTVHFYACSSARFRLVLKTTAVKQWCLFFSRKNHRHVCTMHSAHLYIRIFEFSSYHLAKKHLRKFIT